MDMPGTALVTVVCADEGVKIDMELPSSLPINKLMGKIMEALRNVYAGKFMDGTEYRITCGNRFLKDAETLDGAGVFDGQYLNIIR